MSAPSLPLVPPRPYGAYDTPPQPPNIQYESPPHFDNPLAAPRPHRVDPGLGANMARDLEMTPGFVNPSGRTVSPLPPPQGSSWSPWVPATAAPQVFGRTPSPMPPRLPSPPRDGSLTVPLPSTAALAAAMPTVTQPSHDPQLQLAWARDVLFLVDRTPSLSSSPLAQAAVPLVLSLAASNIPEAVYLRATFAASGAYPTFVPQNPRAAFRDFEAAARTGHAPAWFRLARDYETFSDTTHALDCLARGAKHNDPAALHRLGVAHLLGQLALPANPQTALPYLQRAAIRASLQVPQPAYVFALILLNEFSVPVEPTLLGPFIPSGQTTFAYARALLERAAALHFPPAQYKLGHAFEFASPPAAFPFEPLLSVQWYSLASQAGEAEADMALSKWFLCGADGAFDKDEGLARTFATKAAGKGLASGEFAMGYYCEVGIGGRKELNEARSWYEKASEHGNADAAERLRALSQAAPQALSRTEHDAITENKLMRKRTQAKQRSDATFEVAPQQQQPPPQPQPYLAPKANVPPSSSCARARSRTRGTTGRPARAPRSTTARGTAARRLRAGMGPGRGRMPPVAEHRREASLPPGQRPPPGRDSSLPPAQQRQGSPAQQRPPLGREGSMPSQQAQGRYTLSDDGPRPGSATSAASGPGGRAAGVPPSRRTGTASAVVVNSPPGGGGGPATFAEMGFAGAKAEDKECVIM
ncbi:hypothetical protein B0H10DRAFT_2166603 [Mycena sp. CBHHK59/15]|nr:hypothetical protein B0H10DRAFT_2166603 [Mycena sp. CBHHK59/15]